MKRFSMAMTWLALAGLMTMVSCRKPVMGFTNGEARTVTVSAVTENGDGSKTSIDGLYVKWSEGDEISMNGCRLTLEEGAGGTMGRFTGEVTGSGPYLIGYPFDKTNYNGGTLKLTMPATLIYDTEKEIVPMAAYAEKVGDDVQFRNAVNMLKLQLKGDGGNASKLTSIVLTSATSYLSGDIEVTFSNGIPTFNAIADGAKTMTVSFGDGLQLTGAVQCVYIPLARIGSGEVLTVRFYCANGSFMEKKVTVDANFNDVNNMLSAPELTVNATTDPGYIQSEFTINGSGKKVYFSKGNLQYLGKSDGTGTWRFAEHQWDYMGDGPKTTTGKKGNVDLGTDYEGKYNTGSGTAGPNETEADKKAARDLFGWGCTGFQDIRTSSTGHQTNYKPYSTSTSSVSGGSGINYYGYGPDYDAMNEYGLSVDNNSDWGCLAIGTDPADKWRTLSSAEWVWLLGPKDSPTPGTNCRTSSTINGTENARYAEVKVNGVCGMMIFPDEFAWPSSVTETPTMFNTYSSAWNGVNYGVGAGSDFEALEGAGVVFLPAAGGRNGSSLSNVGSYGYYWSSSCIGSDPAYNLSFGSGSVNPQYQGSRYRGFSVRLVR